MDQTGVLQVPGAHGVGQGGEVHVRHRAAVGAGDGAEPAQRGPGVAHVDAARRDPVEGRFGGGCAEGRRHLGQGVDQTARGGAGGGAWNGSAARVVAEERAGRPGGAHTVLVGVVGAVDQGVPARRTVDQPHVPGRPVVRGQGPRQHQAAGRRTVGVLGQPRLVHMAVRLDPVHPPESAAVPRDAVARRRDAVDALGDPRADGVQRGRAALEAEGEHHRQRPAARGQVKGDVRGAHGQGRRQPAVRAGVGSRHGSS